MNCCSLCEKIYISEEKFHIYLCYDCHKTSSFCLNCDKIMSKIFNNLNIFKCEFCNKVAPAIMKQLAQKENTFEINQINNISSINDTNENKTLFNNSLNFISPNENKLLYPLMGSGNKKRINTPSTYSSFFLDLKNNNNFEKNENINRFDINNINNISSLSDINTKAKINKNFHLINGKKGFQLYEDKKRNIFLQLNNKNKNE